MKRPLKTFVVLAVCIAGVVGVGVNPAGAQGQVEQGNGRSICHFSGLNDEPDHPEEGGRVQSYGQLVRQGLKAHFPSPGDACNPNNEEPEH